MRRPSYLGLVPLPFEASTSFLAGTERGPAAILEELATLDTFDLELGRDPLVGVRRQIPRPHGPELKDAKAQIALAQAAVAKILAEGGFPLVLGGEHTVSIGPIAAALEAGPLGVVQLDAHSDLRDTYEGNPYSHACVIHRALDLGAETLQVGIRSLCEDDAELVARRGLLVVDGRRAREERGWWTLLDALPHRVYLTIDIDAFDPLEVPAVGTPEPGGMTWDAVGDFLTHLFRTKQVVGADVVELMPGTQRGLDDRASIRLATRLVARLIGLAFGRS